MSVNYDAIAAAYRTSVREIQETRTTAERDALATLREQQNKVHATYNGAIEPLRVAYDEAVAVHRRARDEANAADNTAYDEAVKKASVAATEASNAKVDELIKESGAEMPPATAKLFAWMLSGGLFRSQPSACSQVLEAMPMSLVELEKFRNDHGWCDDFTVYLDQAIDAGAYEVDPKELELRKLDKVLRNNVSYTDSRTAIKDVVQQLIDDAVARTRAEFEAAAPVEAETEAKAEEPVDA